jgi:uncharacterized membrane protein
MIGKAKWFQRRKYSGWGLTPKTWQGWAYIAVIIAIATLIQLFPIGDEQTKILITMGLVAIILLDIVHIMATMPMDERDRIHEAIAERNALYAILTALVAGIGWQSFTGVMNGNVQIDPIIIVALVLALVAKAATNIYLDRKN